MKVYIEQLIRNKKKRYKADYNEMLGEYYREIETVMGYNGRQLLELLQNCDDEGANEVLIKLDQKAQTISISNNGNSPFSKKGYRSLFIANLSSKTSKRKFIGNKGLGFRSIINWSNAIEIQSNNLSLKYNEENRLKTFDSLFDKETQEQIIKEEELKKSIIPIPFLSIPKLSVIKQDQFMTSIIIQYKNNSLKKILEQVKNITPETLLFLRNLEIVRFEGFDEDIIDIKTCKEKINTDSKDFLPSEKISFNGNSWLIFEKEGLFKTDFKSNKEEEEFYQIKIAIEENFQRSVSNLYSFFPTNIQLKQPYILHATFDLDPTRNQIIESDKNKIILEKVVHFTIKVAKYFTKNKVSYKPLEILNHKHKADTLNKLGYYELIKEAISHEAIFPCVDNTYKTLKQSLYISDDFADMLQTVGGQNVINVHLIPMNPISLSVFEWKSDIATKLSRLQNVDKVINRIAEREMDDDNRALFISQIVKEGDFLIEKFTNKINFLINDTGERKVIKGDEYIYTTVTKENKLKTPEFANIHFINKDLFEKLLIKFDFEKAENPNKGRFIYDKLKGFCNIHSYEPATLAQKIISEARNQIEYNPSTSVMVIREMNDCLFYNYLQFDDGTKLSDKVRTPSITKNKEIKFIDELMFSNFYPAGKITELIFEGIYTDDDYIDSPSNLGLETDNIDKIESYLKWLGLNDFAVYRQETFQDYGVNDYKSYVKNYSHYGSETGYKTTILSIERLPDILGKISIERFILWIFFDKRLQNQIDDQKNADIFSYSYYGPHYISKKPSFIKYKIITLFRYEFNNFLIDDIYSWVNDFYIDYRKDFFIENGASKSLINPILILLGAKDNFNDLSINKVTDILNKLPEKYPNGKKTQTIYKKALSHFKENNQEINRKVRLFADDGEGLKHFNQSEIYFSDRIKLPKKLKKKYPIFNFPSRSGGADAINFFGINDLKDVHIDLVNYEISKELSDQFNVHLDNLKPLFLAYRIDIDEGIKFKKLQASICKKITIVLCSEIAYKIDGNIYEVADYEFLHQNEYTYYVKVKSEDLISDLRLNSLFTDSCADIISLSFDVSGEYDSFRNLFRRDYNEVLRDVKNNFGEDTFQESRELLGLADYKQAFWQGVLATKGIDYNEQLDDLALENFIKQQLNIDFDSSSLDYEHINNEEEIIKVKVLFADLDLELKDFAVHFLYSISLSKIHFKKIKNEILSRKNLIKSAVWKKLKSRYINEQAIYLSEINKFENYHDFAVNLAEYNEYTFDLNYVIAFEDFAKSLYGDLDLFEAIDINSIRDKNALYFNADELHNIEQSERLKSLLYFEEAVDTIKSELPKYEDLDSDKSDDSDNGDTNSNGHPKILSSNNLKYKKGKSETGNDGHNVFTPKDKNHRRLKEKGNESEKIVFNYLRDNNFEGVDHVAKDNEGLHCDIRYTDENGIVKYVEVKTFDTSRFILTKSEYEFGKSELDNYEIWLVRNKNEIIPIKDFFTNEKYKPVISEYEVYLDLIT